MIEILPPLEKYKYDTWRILPVKCYIDNSVRLRSCIRNVNNPPEHEKWCANVSCPRCTRIQNMTRGSHRMQKNKLGIKCPSTLFVIFVPVPPEYEIVHRRFTPQMHRKVLRNPQIPPNAKSHLWRNMSWRAVCQTRTGPTRA
jgi:hypothetical protein